MDDHYLAVVLEKRELFLLHLILYKIKNRTFNLDTFDFLEDVDKFQESFKADRLCIDFDLEKWQEELKMIKGE